VVLIVGSISAIGGILYATIQSEMKRLLAYSTIENMGIIAAALGAAMVFLATGHRTVVFPGVGLPCVRLPPPPPAPGRAWRMIS
jgi:NADH:ubiquinone oxidoreductase subunit 2 (subunit N)